MMAGSASANACDAAIEKGRRVAAHLFEVAITDVEFAGGTFSVAGTDLKIPILRARETIEAAPADPDTARRLGVPVLYPVMHMTRIMYTTGDRPFELVDIYYRADKYHYSVNMVRVKKGGRWTWNTEVETSA